MEKIKTHEMIIGKNAKVMTERKSHTRVLHIPFEFPDETRGVLIVCKVLDEEWVPYQDIDSVTINFK